jgi:serine/threonine protein phosphatase PrpC
MMTDPEIQTLMERKAPHSAQIRDALVDTANRLGGDDNTTVVVIGADSDATLLDLPPATE